MASSSPIGDPGPPGPDGADELLSTIGDPTVMAALTDRGGDMLIPGLADTPDITASKSE